MKKIHLLVLFITLMISCKKEAPNAAFIGNYTSDVSTSIYISFIQIAEGPAANEVLISGMGQTTLLAVVDNTCLTINHQHGDGNNCFVAGGGCQGYSAPYHDLQLSATDSCSGSVYAVYLFSGYKY